jgi:hypothetical protein
MSGPLDGTSVKYVLNYIRTTTHNLRVRRAMDIASHLPEWFLGWFIKIFSPHFLITASGEGNQPNLLNTIQKRAPRADSFVRHTLGPTPSVTTTFLLLDKNNITKTVSVSEKESGSKTTRFILHENSDVQGYPLKPYDQADITLAAHWLADYHQKTVSGTWCTAQLENEIVGLIESIRHLPQNQLLTPSVEKFGETYSQAFRGNSLPVVTEIGDYSPPNILITPQGHLSVLNWGMSRENGNPLFDVGAFSMALLQRSLFEAPTTPGTTEWFTTAYNHQLQIPVLLAPTYYLLRSIAATLNNAGNNTTAHNAALITWTNLLATTLKYSLS